MITLLSEVLTALQHLLHLFPERSVPCGVLHTIQSAIQTADVIKSAVPGS